jgi:glutamate-ammonia-ligase adenylyltransferase
VANAFEQVFASPQASDPVHESGEQRLLALWEGTLEEAQARAALAAYRIKEPDAVRVALADLRDQNLYRALTDRGRRWIARLIPLLFAAAAAADDPDHALTRTLSVLSAIVGRTPYIALLVEHPAALSMLVRLCAASAWITAQITAAPALLDSLLDSRQLLMPPRRAELSAHLDGALAAIDDDDLEQRMDVLRRFTQSAMLRVAAADVSRAMPLMIVSDHLTELAEVVLGAALAMAWQGLRARYGVPRLDNGERAPFTVIAYGKLGGLELGYTSDLDLVFVYDGEPERATDGPRSLPAQAFFLRLAQRLIHILSTQTIAGRAYEIDMRLRPSGQAGLLITPIEALARYQREHAWTWEHQALVRARPVAGDAGLGARFIALREDVLAREREGSALTARVRAMRERMRRAKDHSNAAALDVKQMRGGLIDIEFMAQFAALRYAHDRREVVRFTDAIRILETLESAGIARYESIRTLTCAYREYRRRIHAQSLQRQRAMIPADALAETRAAVAALWDEWIEAIAAEEPAPVDGPRP